MAGSMVDKNISQKVPMLSGEWWNERISHVMERAEKLFDIDDGILADVTFSGHLPFEEPVTGSDLRKMTPEQLDSYLETLPTVEDKAAVVNALIAAGIPRTLIPRA